MHQAARLDLDFVADAKLALGADPQAFADIVLGGDARAVFGRAHVERRCGDGLFGDRRRFELQERVGRPVKPEGEFGGDG